MSARRIEFTVPEEFLARIDEARGHEPRASFVKRALEQTLELMDLTKLDPSASEKAMDDFMGPVVSPGVRGPHPTVIRGDRKPSTASNLPDPPIAPASSFIKRNVKPIPKGKS